MDAMNALRRRMVDAMTDTGEQTLRVADAAIRVAASLEATGRWADINYTTVGTVGRSWWTCGEHLQRMLLLATAAHSSGGAAPAVLNASIAATQLWLQEDFQDSNWWWNDFGSTLS